MNIERELLKKVISGDNKGDFFISYDLYKEIYEFLVHPEQPEQTEQEPVAWMWEEEFCDEWTTVSSIIKPKSDKQRKNIQPLYIEPPKSEPLTPRQGLEEYKKGYAKAELDLKRERINHDDILDRSIDGSFEYRDGFMDGVMFAENHHGIGVDDE